MRLQSKVIATAVAVLVLGLATAAQAREVYAGNLLPNTGNFPRTGSQRVNIIVNEFTTPAETERLVGVLKTQGQRGLESAMSKLEVGRIRIGGSLSYAIATATVFEDKELNTRRLVLLISRPISYGEFTRGGRSKDYPYTVVELAMDGHGLDDGGSGEMLAAARDRAPEGRHDSHRESRSAAPPHPPGHPQRVVGEPRSRVAPPARGSRPSVSPGTCADRHPFRTT